VTQPDIDPERLAALLDGRLPAAERRAVLDQLAASEPAAEAYVDALAVLSELEPAQNADDPRARGIASERLRWRHPPKRWLAIAALLAGVALAPSLITRLRRSEQTDPSRVVALLAARNRGLPAGWDRGPWSSVRGADQPLTASARAVRLGALLVDLELAVRGHDAALADIARDISDLLEPVPASGPIAAMYRDLGQRAGVPSDDLIPLLRPAGDAAVRLVGPQPAQLGAWVEAARIASVRSDTAFFRAGESRAVLAQAGNLSGLTDDAPEAVRRIQAALASERAPDWSALERDLTDLLRALGS
jgi:hypothetical protein